MVGPTGQADAILIAKIKAKISAEGPQAAVTVA